jgi:hypothetical protein
MWKANLTYRTKDSITKSEIKLMHLKEKEGLTELILDYIAPIVSSHGEDAMIEIHIYKEE